MKPRFERLGVVLSPTDVQNATDGVVNPASARLRDGTLQLYPRLVARGNVSRIGSFSIAEEMDGSVSIDQGPCALEPQAPYEIRTGSRGYGCEDPRVTYIDVLGQYVMAYVAFGPRGPEIALAISNDGLQWERLGLLCFKQSDAPFAEEIQGTVGYVVFPTAIDRRDDRVFEVYYGMADYRIGRGRLTLGP